MAKNACFKGKNRHTNAEKAPFKAHTDYVFD